MFNSDNLLAVVKTILSLKSEPFHLTLLVKECGLSGGTVSKELSFLTELDLLMKLPKVTGERQRDYVVRDADSPFWAWCNELLKVAARLSNQRRPAKTSGLGNE